MAVAGLACGLCVGIRKGDLWIGAMAFGFWVGIHKCPDVGLAKEAS
jgi:hypothetical protein